MLPLNNNGNCAHLQEQILAIPAMVDEASVCELLGLSCVDLSATEKEKKLLRFMVDGRAAYPMFQFDVERRLIQPVVSELLVLKPETWSDFRLLHWLTRPHLDFDGAPSDNLGPEQASNLIAAFRRELVLPEHG